MSAAVIAGCGLAGLLIGYGMRLLVARQFAAPRRTVAAPAVLEVATAALLAALAWRIGVQPELFAYCWLATISVPLAAIDWRTHRLPTRLVWPGGLVLVVLFAVAAVVDEDWRSLIRALAAMVVTFAFYGAIYALRPGELGGGDLRLSGVLGFSLGWLSWTAVLTGTLLGWIAAAIAIVVRRLAQRTTADDIPLGPFLIAATFATVLVQPAL